MTEKHRDETISQINALINEIVLDRNDNVLPTAKPAPEKVEMLTIKECTEVIHGLSEYTVRKLVAQGKIPHIRAGQGKRGKILINKDYLIGYFKNSV